MTTGTHSPLHLQMPGSGGSATRSRVVRATAAAVIAAAAAFAGGAWWGMRDVKLTRSPLTEPETTPSAYSPAPAMMMPRVHTALATPERGSPQRMGESTPARRAAHAAQTTASSIEATNAATRQLNRYDVAKVEGEVDTLELSPPLERSIERAETNLATRRLTRMEVRQLQSGE